VRARSLFVVAVSLAAFGCGWDPGKPFDRESPEVNQAIRALDGGDATVASSTLEDYLSTGPCSEGNIGTPELVKRRPNGGFDLGLSLFKIGEAFGRRFGEEELDGGLDEKTKALRGEQIACAVRILSAIESYGVSPSTPAEFVARARYLEGNLNFLDGHYEEAVAAYDKALRLAPGESDGGDPVGRDAAWNRAIAMRRIEDKKDAGPDSGSDGGKDGGKDAGGDSGSEGKDSGNDSANIQTKTRAERHAAKGKGLRHGVMPNPAGIPRERVMAKTAHHAVVRQLELFDCRQTMAATLPAHAAIQRRGPRQSLTRTGRHFGLEILRARQALIG